MRYLEERASAYKWQLEQEIMARLIEALPRRATVLDIPIGTGRYLQFYARGEHEVIGLDVSHDMLLQAGADRNARTLRALIRGDATAIPLRDGAVDYVVSTRLMNWLPVPLLGLAFREFARVAARGVILGIRESERMGWHQLPALGAEFAAAPLASLRRSLRPIKVWGQNRLGGTEPPGILLHPSAHIRDGLAAYGLVVDDVITIKEGTAFSRRPFRYAPLRVYVLRSRAPTSGSPQ